MTVSTLQIFVRPPVAGQVKTRLIPLLGPEQSLKIYTHMLEHCIEQASRTDYSQLEIWSTGDLQHDCFSEFLRRYKVSLNQQQGDDLGARMSAALQRGLAYSDTVVLVGSDCPALDVDIMQLAASQLTAARPFVLGPAADGGYYLVGMHCSVRHSGIFDTLFLNMNWGESEVLEQTRARLRACRLSWSELPLLNDVDVPEDLASQPDSFRRWLTAAEIKDPASGDSW